MSKTVRVPVLWLKKLIDLSNSTEVRYVPSLISGEVKVDRTELVRLKGYIESAEALIPGDDVKGEGPENE